MNIINEVLDLFGHRFPCRRATVKQVDPANDDRFDPPRPATDRPAGGPSIHLGGIDRRNGVAPPLGGLESFRPRAEDGEIKI